MYCVRVGHTGGPNTCRDVRVYSTCCVVKPVGQAEKGIQPSPLDKSKYYVKGKLLLSTAACMGFIMQVYT